MAAAQARAIMVLPVPGGPCINTPLGGWMPMFSKRSSRSAHTACWKLTRQKAETTEPSRTETSAAKEGQ